MADYPAAIYTPRARENRPGVVYDEDNLKTLYAEDFEKTDDEIIAIQTELGTDPKGEAADVAARIQAIEDNISSIFEDVGITIDGVGEAISTGSKGYRRIPFDCIITGWTILGKESGSAVVDVKKCNYAGFPTTASIAGSEKPTLAAAQKNQDIDLTTWTDSITAGDIIEFVVDSAETITRLHIFLHLTRI